MQVAVVSDTGLVRTKNQDRYMVALDRKLFVVCDGMGGHKGGEIASSLAIDIIDMAFSVTLNPVPSLYNAIQSANQVIYAKGHKISEFKDMGTTLTAAVIVDGVLYVANIGDSSLFLLKGNRIKRLTYEHTLAQKMAEEGFLDQSEVKRHPFNHILTRALGVAPTVEIDFFTEPVEKGQYILMATDGLTDLVEEEELRALIYRHHMASLEVMLRLALERGGHDNVTAVLIQV